MENTFGNKLKEARKAKQLTQKQLADKIGAKHNSISDWENDKNKPDPDTIELLCGVLEITPNYLLTTSEDDFSPYEKLLIKKHRFISRYSPDGKKLVEYILNHEYRLAEELKQRLDELSGKAEIIAEYKSAKMDSAAPKRYIQYYQRLASAGTGQIVFDTPPTDLIEIPDTPNYHNASYAIGVNGDSMEPLYSDGDILLVEKVESIDAGEIGIFMVDGESYVKKLGENKELLSLNKLYSAIPLDDNSWCMGRVVDKLRSESPKLAPEEIYDLLSDSDRLALEEAEILASDDIDSSKSAV